MCHPEVPPGATAPAVLRAEISIETSTGETVPTMLAEPEGGGGPAVVVIADIFGRSPFYEDLAARAATAGFTALLPDLFFRQGPLAEPTREAAFERRSRLDADQALRDTTAVVEHGRALGARVGTVGFCMGGTIVLQLAASAPALASVCFYGFPAGGSPSPLDVADRIEGPILGFWGDQDTGVGMDNVAALADALDARGVEFEHTIYPGLGHGFMSASRLDPAHEAYQAACESWTRAVEFWRARLPD
jgi:carboxymethylenebutenolidase